MYVLHSTLFYLTQVQVQEIVHFVAHCDFVELDLFFIWCALQILYCGIFPQEVKYYPPWIILYPKNVVELRGTLPPLTHYGLTGRPIKNAKVPKKVRNGAQKSGMMTRNLEHQFFSSVIENYIRYSALHQIFCVTVPSSGSILFHN